MGTALFVRLNVCGSIYVYRCRALLVIGCTCYYAYNLAIGLHNVVSPAAMARVMVQETYIVDGIPTTIKADNAYGLFCAYTASNHQAINNHVRMPLRAIMVCG